MSKSIRTDLALEAAAPFAGNLPQGVSVQEQKTNQILITTVTISTPQAAEVMGKSMGEYITVETPPFCATSLNTDEEIAAISQTLARLLPKEGLVLVVGLGNENITPDALGPQVARQILATRHMSFPKEEGGFPGFRPVAVLAPGVLGQTGIETAGLIRALVEDLHPVAVIAVDALASRSLDRLGSTLQMADSGIAPGSGVQNRRQELSRATLGIPVISMGVPTVVDGATLAWDLLGQNESGQTPPTCQGEPVMVTPRDIDLLIQRAAKVTAMAINLALQPQLTMEDIAYLME